MRNSAFSKRLIEELDGLVAAGVLDAGTAERLRLHYAEPPGSSTRLLLLTFSILGALLIGGGVILLIAHNWDAMDRWMRAVFSFLPLVAMQAAAFHVLRSKEKSLSRPWREGVAVGWHISLACSIALISQTYNLGGTLKDFLFAWMVLSIPIAYLLDSGFAAALTLIVLTVWRFHQFESQTDPLYWLYLAALIPYGVKEFLKDSQSGKSALLGWVLSLAVFAGVIPVTFSSGRTLPIFFALCGGAYYLSGRTWFPTGSAGWKNPMRLLGTDGLCVLVMVSSYADFWKSITREKTYSSWNHGVTDVELYALLAGFGALWVYGAWKTLKGGEREFWGLGSAPLVVGIATLLSLYVSPFAASILINVYGLAAGIWLMVSGARSGKLSTVNVGMGLVSILAFLRFVDASQEIIPRAIALMIIGAAFLGVNRKLAKSLKGARP